MEQKPTAINRLDGGQQPATRAVDWLSSQPIVEALPPKGAHLFEALPPDQTGVDFQLHLPDVKKHVREVIHLNVYGGICTGDYDGDGLTDFYVTSPVGGNRLYQESRRLPVSQTSRSRRASTTPTCKAAAPRSSTSTTTAIWTSTPAATGGRTACSSTRARMRWTRPVREQAARFGLDFNGASMTMAFADMDNDGDLDGYLATTAQAAAAGHEVRGAFRRRQARRR